MLAQLSICIFLVKLMSLAEQSFADFQAVLDRHRANEAAYKDRLKEINLTRSKIADQLEALQQTYDKKLRGLQQKLQALRGQNDTLLRQNTLYRSEIQTYQSRLLEKEKIIAALLSQRRDLPVVGSSEKSKSDKTDSLNANEEESKAFKKQPVFKEDYDHPVSSHQKFKQESPVQRHVQPVVSSKNDKPVQRPHQHDAKPAPPPKKKVAPPVLPQEITNQKPSLAHVQEPPKTIEKVQTVEVKHALPPPPPRAGRPKEKAKPKKNPFNYAEPNEQNLDANNFFGNLGRVQTSEVKHEQTKPIDEVHVVNEQQSGLRQESHHFEQEEISVPAEVEYEENIHIQQDIKEEAPHQQQQNQFQQQFEQPQFQQQNQNEYQHYKEEEFQPQPQEDQTQTPEPSQQNSDFLSHFNAQPQTGNFYQPLPIKAKPKKKNPRTVVRQEIPAEPVEPQANGNDFFAQLPKGQHEHHQLDNIEQSSIDHIDRDNSLLSNEQPYFVQEPAPKRPVKMSKKKKRDQIKMMDPSCFE